MKKRVILMAGLLAMALAGQAQAAGLCTTCAFAVQDATGTNDLLVVSNAVSAPGWIGIGTPTPLAPVHVVTSGNSVTSAGFNYTFTNTGTLSPIKAPNFTFYRSNGVGATGTPNPNDATLPRANDTLGSITFGTIAGGFGSNMITIGAKAEGTPTVNSQPGYTYISTVHDVAGAGSLTEKFRLTSLGNVIIPTVTTNTGGGNLIINEAVTATSKSKLHVNGLVYYANNAAAVLGTLAVGDFYRCGASDATADTVCVVH